MSDQLQFVSKYKDLFYNQKRHDYSTIILFAVYFSCIDLLILMKTKLTQN